MGTHSSLLLSPLLTVHHFFELEKMKVLIVLDQSDMANWTFRAFLELDIKESMEIDMLYMHNLGMTSKATGDSAVAIQKLLEEKKFENEAEALIHHFKTEFKEELGVFDNPINVVYTEIDCSDAKTVISKTLEHIDTAKPDKIVFG